MSNSGSSLNLGSSVAKGGLQGGFGKGGQRGFGGGAKKVLFSVFGNMFEWYDYTLYVAFVPVFTKHFFADYVAESSKGFVRTAAAFGVFAVGYLARPIGGVLFGYIGDFKGRAFALQISVWSMTVSAAAIGLLPTASVIGGWAPFLLILLRLCQGVSVGGEFNSSSAYLVEIAPKGRGGFYGSFVMFSLAMGIIMGSLMFLLVNWFFGQEALFAWAWRLPFLFSLVLGVVLVYLRKGLVADVQDGAEGAPAGVEAAGVVPVGGAAVGVASGGGFHRAKIAEIFGDIGRNKSNLLVSFFVALGDGVPFYVFVVAFPSMLGSLLGYSQAGVAVISVIIMLSYAFATLVSGMLSDRVGAKLVMAVGTILIAFGSLSVAVVFVAKKLLVTYCASVLLGFVVGIYHGALPYFLLTSFPASSRATIVSLTYNVGMTIFGATAPAICFLLLDRLGGSDVAVGAIVATVAFSAMFAFFAILLRKKPV